MTRKLAGRCECGILESMARDDSHNACRGERRCRVCGTVKPLSEFYRHTLETTPRRVCLPCKRAAEAKHTRARFAADPARVEAHRRSARESARRQRRAGAESYVSEKARKRAVYARRKEAV